MSLLDGLVSHWKLDEASGTRADSHGGYDADDGLVSTASGKVYALAASFPGTPGQGLAVTPVPALRGDQSFTIAGWLQRSSGAGTIIAKQDLAEEEEYLIYVDWNSVTLEIAGADLSYPSVDAPHAITPGEWFFFFATYEAGVGLAAGVDTDALTETAFTGPNLANSENSGTLKIGAATWGDEWPGLLTAISFCSRVLSAGKRAPLRNSGDGLDYEDFAPPAPEPVPVPGGAGPAVFAPGPARVPANLRGNKWTARQVKPTLRRGF